MLKAVYANKSDIPAGAEAFYKEVNGQWELQVDGMKTQGDVDRVTEALRKERSDHSETKAKLHKFEGYTLEDITKLEDENALLKADGKSADIDEKVNALVDARTKALKRDLANAERRATEAEASVTTLKSERSKDKIDAAVVNVAANKVRPEALADVKLHAVNDFELSEDGKVVTKETCPLGAGLTVEEWTEKKIKASPHWESPSQGGGARGGKGGGGNENPWSKKTWNVTRQHQIASQDPAKAKQLQEAAKAE